MRRAASPVLWAIAEVRARICRAADYFLVTLCWSVAARCRATRRAPAPYLLLVWHHPIAADVDACGLERPIRLSHRIGDGDCGSAFEIVPAANLVANDWRSGRHDQLLFTV